MGGHKQLCQQKTGRGKRKQAPSTPCRVAVLKQTTTEIRPIRTFECVRQVKALSISDAEEAKILNRNALEQLDERQPGDGFSLLELNGIAPQTEITKNVQNEIYLLRQHVLGLRNILMLISGLLAAIAAALIF